MNPPLDIREMYPFINIIIITTIITIINTTNSIAIIICH